jgi:carboxylesterase type B
MGETDITLARTALGQARGVADDGLVRFRGIPFAQAPVGLRRFAPPVPYGPWRGVLDATRHGPVAPQGPSRLVAVMTRPAGRARPGCTGFAVRARGRSTSSPTR